jgi:hypothetical protein
MSRSRQNARRRPWPVVRWGSLMALGLVLAACESSTPTARAPADCDTTVPLNHCGAYMPEYNPNNHS